MLYAPPTTKPCFVRNRPRSEQIAFVSVVEMNRFGSAAPYQALVSCRVMFLGDVCTAVASVRASRYTYLDMDHIMLTGTMHGKPLPSTVTTARAYLKPALDLVAKLEHAADPPSAVSLNADTGHNLQGCHNYPRHLEFLVCPLSEPFNIDLVHKAGRLREHPPTCSLPLKATGALDTAQTPPAGWSSPSCCARPAQPARQFRKTSDEFSEFRVSAEVCSHEWQTQSSSGSARCMPMLKYFAS